MSNEQLDNTSLNPEYADLKRRMFELINLRAPEIARARTVRGPDVAMAV